MVATLCRPQYVKMYSFMYKFEVIEITSSGWLPFWFSKGEVNTLRLRHLTQLRLVAPLILFNICLYMLIARSVYQVNHNQNMK